MVHVLSSRGPQSGALLWLKYLAWHLIMTLRTPGLWLHRVLETSEVTFNFRVFNPSHKRCLRADGGCILLVRSYPGVALRFVRYVYEFIYTVGSHE